MLQVFVVADDAGTGRIADQIRCDGSPKDAIAVLKVSGGSVGTVLASKLSDASGLPAETKNTVVALPHSNTNERILHAIATRVHCLRRRFDCGTACITFIGCPELFNGFLAGNRRLLDEGGKTSVWTADDAHESAFPAEDESAGAFVCPACRALVSTGSDAIRIHACT